MRTLRMLVAAAVLVGGVSVAAPALADSYVGVTPPQVGRVDVGVTAVTPRVRTVTTSGLALTGADIAELSALGALSVGAGGLLVVRARRRTA